MAQGRLLALGPAANMSPLCHSWGALKANPSEGIWVQGGHAPPGMKLGLKHCHVHAQAV